MCPLLSRVPYWRYEPSLLSLEDKETERPFRLDQGVLAMALAAQDPDEPLAHSLLPLLGVFVKNWVHASPHGFVIVAYGFVFVVCGWMSGLVVDGV